MTNFRLSELPAFLLLIMVAVGIAVGMYCFWNIFLLCLVIFIAIVSGLILYKLGNNFYAFLVCGVAIGLIISFSLADNSPVVLDKTMHDIPAVFEGKIEKILAKDSMYIRCIAKGELDAQPFKPIQNAVIVLSIFNPKNLKINFYSGSTIYASVKIHPPRLKNLPNEPDEVNYASFLDAQWFARAYESDVAVLGKPKGMNYLREQISEVIQYKLNNLFSEENKGLAIALVTGDQTKVPKETRLAYSYSGTIHVLAVSGLHVGIISVMIYLLTGFFRYRWLKFAFFSICLVSYLFITGFQPSAIRAGFMAITFMFLYTVERKIVLLNVLSFVVLIIIIFQPEMIYSAGFQMSVASLFGIGFFYPLFEERFNQLFNSESINFISSSLAITLSASVAVTPIVAYYFEIYSLVSPLANLIVVPLTSFSLIFSVISLFFSFFWWQVAVIYANTADVLLILSNWICHFANDIPAAYIKSSNIFPLSILMSSAIIYLFLSDSIRKFLFRFGLSSLVAIMFTIILTSLYQPDVRFFPRENVVLTEVQISKSIKFALISDRRNTSRALRDYSLETYLAETKDSLTIGVTGLSSIGISDEIKKKKKFRIVELDIASQKKINNLIDSKIKIPQLTNLKY